MKVVIIGAGDVGTHSAQTMAELHDILIIEKDPVVANSVSNRLSVSVLNEDATNFQRIRKTVSDMSPELVLACTGDDACNMYLCLMFKMFIPDIKTAAAISNPENVVDVKFNGFRFIDKVISPENTAADKMYHLATLSNAIDYETIESLGSAVCTFKVTGTSKVLGEHIMHLDVPEGCVVFGLYRDKEFYTVMDTMQLRDEDVLAVFGNETALYKFNDIINDEYPMREFAILGASLAGVRLAQKLSSIPKYKVTLVEKDPAISHMVNEKLSNAIVVNADFNDPDIHQDYDLFKVDCTLCASRKDENNLLISMSGQVYKARKVVTRYFKKEYEDIFLHTGDNCVISYPSLITNEITKIFIDDKMAVARLKGPSEIFFSHIVDGKSKLINRYYGDIFLPQGIAIICVVRNDELIYPLMDTCFESGDNVIVFTNRRDSNDLTTVFGRKNIPEL